jgi:stage V sporulation protein G
MVKILNANPTMDTASVTVSAIGITEVKNAGKLRALADVEVVFDGIEMIIQGVKIQADGKSTEVSLPTYRAPDGSWRPAIILPDEIKAAISDTVIAAGLEAEILRVKEESLADQCMKAGPDPR